MRSLLDLLAASLTAIHASRSHVHRNRPLGSTSRSIDTIEANTYGLPEGEPIALELRRWFKKQRRAVLKAIPSSWPLPMHLPLLGRREWVDPMATAMVPILKPYWMKSYEESSSRLSRRRSIETVVNPPLRQQIERQSFNFCRSTNESTSRRLEDALDALKHEFVQGLVVQGDAISQLTERVNEIFEGLTERHAATIAATEASRALHAAQEQAAFESGVVAGKEWLISADACDLCVKLATESKRVRLGQAFAIVGNHPEYSTIMYPPAHPNCFLPKTPIRAPGRVAGIKAHYDGPIVRINLARGGEISVTPNHLFLTPTGFASADSLMEGDDVLCYSGADGAVLDAPDDDGKPTTIEEVVAALAVSSGMTSYAMPVAPVDIHGDGRFCDGDIHVIAPNGLLMGRRNTLIVEECGEDRFVVARGGSIGFDELGDLFSVLVSLGCASHGGVSSLGEREPLLRTQFSHADHVCLGAATNLNSGLLEVTNDGRTGDDERIRECQNRLSSKVTTDKVLNVNRDSLHYRGPVYDVQTTTQLYTVGSGNAIAHNCRCSMIDVLMPEYGGPADVEWGLTLFQPQKEIEGGYEPPRGLKVPEPEPERAENKPEPQKIEEP